MKQLRNLLGPSLAAVAVVLSLGAAPGMARAQDGGMPCSAFARNSYGSWRVMAPVMLDLEGRLYSPTVGTVLSAGVTQHGIEMSDLLDQQCGNR